MDLRRGYGVRGLAGALAFFAVVWSAGLAVAQAAGPDLAVSIAAKPKDPARHRSVEISITVTNQGQAPASGTVVTLNTRGGLHSPRLINATPDTVQTSCSLDASGAPTCSITPVAPVCRSSANRLTCRYSSYQLQPAGQPNNSLTIIAGATTGTTRRETAIGSASSDSPDANQANNSAVFTFYVKGKKRHRR